MAKLAWGKKVSPEFKQILAQGCKAMRWGPEAPSALMACMAFETGETFSPSVKNPNSTATGLIQFMRATAKDLGTTTEKLAAMTAEQQLRWVFKYFDQFQNLKGPDKNYADIYMAILMPRAIGEALDAVIFYPGEAYRVNAGLDANKDGFITKREAAAKIEQKLQKGLGPEYVTDE